MRYLKCIAMLNYALRVLKADTRQSVPVSKMSELLTLLTSLRAMLNADQVQDTMVQVKMMDLLSSVVQIQKSAQGIMTLTDNMKQGLIDGVNSVKDSVCVEAFKFYRTNDFEPTPEVIPVMREVVERYAQCGGKI